MGETFLDRFGEQLAAAERAMSATPASAEERRPRRLHATRRTGVIVLCGLAVAVPAVAATEPWRPLLGRPELSDTPRGVATSPVPESAVELLGVMRRPQGERDRGARSQRLLRVVGQQVGGVRLDSVRLAGDALGHDALIVSTESVGGSGAAGGISDAICLVFSSGVNCGTAADLVSGNFFMTAGETVRGLVPDGVARVVLTFSGGESLSAQVHDNVYWLSAAPTTSTSAPRQSPGDATKPAPMVLTRPFSTQWLNTRGEVIGPPLGK